jgi:hypothetical protein
MQAVLMPKVAGEWEDIQIKASDFVLTHRGLVLFCVCQIYD